MHKSPSMKPAPSGACALSVPLPRTAKSALSTLLLLGERCTNPQKQCYHALAEWEKQSQASRYLLTRLSWGSFYFLLGSLWSYRCIHCQDDKAPTSPSTKNKKSTFAEVHGSCHGDFQGVFSQAWPRLCYARISILLCHCLC